MWPSLLNVAELALMAPAKKAFTMAELILVALLLGIMAYIAVPRLQYAVLRKQKADTVSMKIATDLRLTRRTAVSSAAQNIAGYALNMTGVAPYSGYQIVNLDTGQIVSSRTIDSEISCTGGASFRFGPLGNLLPGSDTNLVVSAEGRSFTITVVSATGAVKCVEN